MKIVYFSHSIFLKEAEMHILQTPENYIETIGICVPVMKGIEGPAKEVICPYKIHTSDSELIQFEENGFRIVIKKKSAMKILPVKQGGIDGLNISYQGNIIHNANKFPIVHQVSIASLEKLQESMCWSHLFQTDSK